MANLMVGNRHGFTAKGNQTTLLATVLADGANDNEVIVDDAEHLEVGMVIDIAVRSTGVVLAEDRTIEEIIDNVVAVSEVQEIAVDATGGVFTVTFSGQTTADLAFDVAAVDFTAALVALSNIAPGDVVVTGGPGDDGGTTPYVLTWNSALGNVAEPTTTVTGLTGGAGTAAVTTVTAGVAAVGIRVQYSGADVDPDNTYGLYPANGYAATGAVNLNGGTTFGAGLDIPALNDIDSMRARLAEIDANYYTTAMLNTMTTNDMAYAIRLNDFPGSI